MPAVSVQQLRAMYAAKEGKSNLGIPPSVGADFVQATHGVTGLPRRAPNTANPSVSLRDKLRSVSNHNG
jgi:hypothetical protein